MQEYGIIRDLPVPVMFVNRTMDVIEISRAALTLFNLGYCPGDHARNRQAMAGYFGAKTDLRELLGATLMRVGQSGVSEKVAWHDGDRLFMLLVAADTRTLESGAPLFLVYIDDHTEQLAIQRSHAQARSYLESIMSSLYLGIIVTDCDLRVTNLNRAQESFLQRTGTRISLLQAVGMALPELLPDEEDLLEKIGEEVLQAGMVCGGIVEHVETPDGAELVFNVSFYPLRDEHNRIVGMIRVCEDVTEKAKLESELRQAESQALELSTVRKVIVTLNHEINNALMIVVGSGEVLLRTPPELNDDKQNLVRTILEQAEKITSVTQQLESMQSVRTEAYLDDGTQMVSAQPPE